MTEAREQSSSGPADGSWRQIALGASVFSAAALVTLSGMPGLPDTDPYRHMAYAMELVRSGFSLRGHPFLPYTLLGESGVDLWWAYHWLLVPLTPLGVLWGARVAAVLGAGLVGGSLTWFLDRAGQRRAVLFALLPLGMSGSFVLRDACARPVHLTIPLLLVSLAAGAGALRWWVALPATMAHLFLHLSAPLAPVFAGMGWLAERSVGRRTGPRAVLASVSGLLLGLLLRPDRDRFPEVAALTNLGALGVLSGGLLPHAGAELGPIGAGPLVAEVWVGLVVLGAGAWMSRKSPPPGDEALRRAVLFAVGLCLIMTMRSARFVDYLAPLLAVAGGLCWPLQFAPRWHGPLRVAAVAVALAGGWGYSRGVARAWNVGNRYMPLPGAVEAFSAQVRERVPPGQLLFSDDFFLNGVLWSSLPEYRFLAAYEPALLHVPHPELFWSWHHAVTASVACDQPVCPGATPNPLALGGVLARLGTEWAVTSYPPDVFSVQTLLLEGIPGVELAAAVPAGSFGLFLWHWTPGRAPPSP